MQNDENKLYKQLEIWYEPFCKIIHPESGGDILHGLGLGCLRDQDTGGYTDKLGVVLYVTQEITESSLKQIEKIVEDSGILFGVRIYILYNDELLESDINDSDSDESLESDVKTMNIIYIIRHINKNSKTTVRCMQCVDYIDEVYFTYISTENFIENEIYQDIPSECDKCGKNLRLQDAKDN